MKQRLFTLSLFLLLLGGCGLLPAEEEVPTLIPEEHVPTAIALTAQALVEENAAQAGDAGTAGDAPDPATSPIPATPTVEGMPPTVGAPTPTGSPTSSPPPPTQAPPPPSPTTTSPPITTPEVSLLNPIPYGNIQILSPGRLSKIASPLQLHAFLSPGDGGEVWVALFGEDGRLLLRDTFILLSSEKYRTHLIEDLEFEIPGPAESARLEITTYDEYGRVSALATQDLVLIASGASDVNYPSDLYEGIIIQQPSPSRLIQGGKLVVTGFTRYAPENELRLEIVDVEGKVMASKVIGVADQDLGEGYRAYAGEIPYQVGTPLWAQVQVSARDHKMSGVVHISSVVVLLSP